MKTPLKPLHGKVIRRIYIPEIAGDVCFGGQKKNCLFIVATSSLYPVLLDLDGV
ncbi:MAG: hypothetical protein AAF360_09135 [Pseudomonadota bacterium]